MVKYRGKLFRYIIIITTLYFLLYFSSNTDRLPDYPVWLQTCIDDRDSVKQSGTRYLGVRPQLFPVYCYLWSR